jgi:hypothetical protein
VSGVWFQPTSRCASHSYIPPTAPYKHYLISHQHKVNLNSVAFHRDCFFLAPTQINSYKFIQVNAAFVCLFRRNNSRATKCKVGKAIPVTVRGGPQGCETLRLPHFLDNRLRNGSEVVSLTRRPAALNP